MAQEIFNPMQPITEAQKCFIPHVLKHVYPEIAAQQVGISEEVVRQWMRQPAFKSELDRQRRESAVLLIMSLEKIAHKAVHALGELVDSKNDATRLKAAECILDKVIPYAEHYQLKEGIAELKEIAQQTKANCAQITKAI